MPLYIITGPDGVEYEIEGPAGASKEQVIKAVQAKLRPEPELPDYPVAPEKAGLLRRVGDVGVGLAQGVVGLPEALVGLADIPTMGAVGKAAKDLGVDFQRTKDILQEYKSAEQQAAEQYVGEAEGFFDTLGRAVERPSAITNTIAQSLPSMFGGAALARGALAAGAIKNPLVAGAVGEGAISAGATAEGVRQQTESGYLAPEQSAIAAVSGVLTGSLGVLGAKAGKYLGVEDIDTILAGGASQAEKGSIIAGAIKGALSESLLEELPQSAQEQVANNLALGKPWDEGVAEAAAMGVLAALPLGGAGGAAGRFRANQAIETAQGKTQEVADADAATDEALERLNIVLPEEGQDGGTDTGVDTEAAGESVSVPSGAEQPSPTGGVAGPDTGDVDGAGDTTVRAGKPAGTSDAALTAKEGETVEVGGKTYKKTATGFELVEEAAPAVDKTALKERAQQKTTFEQERQAELDAFNAAAPERSAAMDEAELDRVNRQYRVAAPGISADQTIIDQAETAYTTEKDENAPTWGELNKRDKAMYVKNAGLYEINRKTAAKENKIDYPEWSRLSPEARSTFISSLPKEGKITGLGLNQAFSQVAPVLEAENVAYRDMRPTDVTNKQTILQEKSSLDIAQRETAVDKIIQENTANQGITLTSAAEEAETGVKPQPAWSRVLETLLPEQESVPGQARVMSATPAIAEKIKTTLDRVGGDVNIVYGNMNEDEIAEGRVARFDPRANTITIDRAQVANQNKALVPTIMHEVTHYMLDHVIDNPKNLSPQQKQALKNLENLYKNVKDVESTITKATFGEEYEIGSLKEFLSEVMANDGLRRDLANLEITEPNKNLGAAKNKLMRYILQQDPNAKNQSVLSYFVKKVADLLGFGNAKPNVLQQVLRELENIIDDQAYTAPTAKMRGKDVSYAGAPAKTVKAPPPIDQTMDQMKAAAENNTPRASKNMWEREASWLVSHDAGLWAAKNLQNERYPLKRWQEMLKMGNLLQVDGKFNNIYDYVTNAFGRAQYFNNTFLTEPVKQLNEALNEYVNTTKEDTRRALATLSLYLEALHEPERRHIKYLKLVPLSITTKVADPTNNGALTPAATVRRNIFDALENAATALPDNTISAYRTALEAIVANHKEVGGASLDGGAGSNLPLDENDSKYRVSAYSSDNIKTILADLNGKPEIKAVVAKISRAQQELSEKTIVLNKEAGYWTDQVDNFKKFYGFKNYVPFKGKRNDQFNKDNLNFALDPNNIALSTELKQTIGGFEGTVTNVQNTILQSLADATSAAARAGRGQGYTQSIRNAIDQKLLKGEVVKTLTFAERRNMTEELEGLINQRNIILNYNRDGSVDVMKVDDPELLESIRRPFPQDASFLTEALNKVTSFFGQMHTRYNPSFPALNYVRDVLTNAYIMMAEGDPNAAARFATAAAKNVVKFPQAMRIVKAFHDGDATKLKALAKKDSFSKDLVEYMEQGGRVAYAQALSVQSGINNLRQQIGRNGVLKTKDQVEKFFDIWTDMFEMTARTSAYGIVKGNNIAKGMSPEAAAFTAASHVKQYANFEEVGKMGKELGAMFMFFRPAMTGAVRSIEAILPALRSFESVRKNLSPDIYGTYDSVSGKYKTTPEQEKALAAFKKNYETKQKAARIAMGSLTAAGAVVYLMAVAAAGDDEEDRNKILTDDMSRWTRFARFVLADDLVVQIPWGFGLGAFPALGAQVMGMTSQYNSSMLDSLGNIIEIGLDSFLPLPVSRMNPFDNFSAWMMDTVTPSALRPIYQFTMNTNSFGYEIYNNRQTRINDAYTGGDNVPELYKMAAQTLYEATDGGIDWSPNTMYFMLNSYLDGVSRIAHNGVGMGMTLAGVKEFDPKKDIPLIESYLSRLSNIDNRQYGDLDKEIGVLRKKLTTMKERNPDMYMDFLDKNPYAEVMVDSFDKKTGGMLNKLRAQANDIRAMSDLTPKERKELLDENKLMQGFVKRSIVSDIEMYKEMDED